MPTPRELLGPHGPLAQAMAGYEHRAGQLDMADAVARALREDRVLLCEAGTGTGKTLAYLVPALLAHRKVVVSTATKALQEQIFFKDLPLLGRHLGLRVDAVLVKGLGNYLCRRRLRELAASLGAELPLGEPPASIAPAAETVPPSGRARAHAEALGYVERWAASTESGDISEARELPEDHPIWAEVTASSDTRIGPGCPYHEGCFVTQLKRKADRADLLVVNHHLLFADLAAKGDHPGGVLPAYDAVILDEAHKIEDIATSFFGRQVSSTAVERLLRDSERALVQARLHADPKKTPPLVARAQKDARRMFSALGASAALEAPRNGSATSAEGREPLLPEAWSGALLDAYHQLDQSLEALGALAGVHSAEDRMRTVGQRVAALRDNLARIVEPERAQITWCERRARSVSIASSPIDVGPVLRKRLFERGLAAVLTSASLSTGGSFAFVRSRLGLEGSLCVPSDELEVSSALDYRAQALVYTPTDLPEVNDDGFAAQAVVRIRELLALSGGGAFVLCTSLRNMKIFAAALGSDAGLELMVQGEAPKSALLERFRASGNAVLVATMSFWEGVDVPGQALRMVVIDRIPFAVPSDPVVAARCQALELAGRQPFTDYMLPQAAITLKQGFGRLLRTRHDWGVVAILDRRVCTRGYGRVLLASLPAVRHTTSRGDLEAFWQEHARDSVSVRKREGGA
jgi:ATP-dependent DNA helicase DinG